MTRASTHPLAWIAEELSALDERGLRRELRLRTGRQGPLFEVAGRAIINFGSNDYLGLAGDARLATAAADALAREGTGGGASPLLIGRSESHARLEDALARFERCEAALIFPSGFAANLGVIAALAGRGDAIFADQLNHASLIDGCRLSRAKVFVYPHNDVGRLEALLCEHTGYRRRLIVADSLFSMDGDLAPLDQLAAAAERHGCMLVVDEAHATGVLGATGRGACEHFGVADRVSVRIGTLSKALGAGGGFVVGERRLVDWLTNAARPYVFSTAASPANCAAALAALESVDADHAGGQRLLDRAARFRDELHSLGIDTGASETHIVPIHIGDPARAVELAQALWRAGVYAPAIRPPTVPHGGSRLRISLCAGHTEEMIERLLTALADAIRPSDLD